MKTSFENYKNIDKSTQLLIDEKDTFKVFHFSNLSHITTQFKEHFDNNYLQLFFCTKGSCKIAFNIEYCAIELKAGNSNMVYFKDDEMLLLWNIQPKSELFSVLISIEYFHSLFDFQKNVLFDFNNFKSGKPIIEPKSFNNAIQAILSQLITKRTNATLRQIFIKGKIYELLSYYFSTSTETDSENCPYIANEEIASQIIQAKEIVIENMNNPPSLDEIAKKVGLNIKKLKTSFKEFYGVPVFAFLLNYKMDLAKTILQEKRMNVNELAIHLGYSTSSHFIAAFKRKYKITPKQFAKSV